MGDAGPGGGPRRTGWLLATWVVMMAAIEDAVPFVLIRYESRDAAGADGARSVQRAAFFAGLQALWVARRLARYELSRSCARDGDEVPWGNGGRGPCCRW